MGITIFRIFENIINFPRVVEIVFEFSLSKLRKSVTFVMRFKIICIKITIYFRAYMYDRSVHFDQIEEIVSEEYPSHPPSHAGESLT